VEALSQHSGEIKSICAVRQMEGANGQGRVANGNNGSNGSFLVSAGSDKRVLVWRMGD
jgi:hypothetical protein